MGFFSRFHSPNKEEQLKMSAIPTPPEWSKRKQIRLTSISNAVLILCRRMADPDPLSYQDATTRPDSNRQRFVAP